MRLQRLGSIGLAILLAMVSVPLFSDARTTPKQLTQTSADRQAEAQQLTQQGLAQLQTSQYEAALQSFQMALNIYRAIKDRRGEGQALGNLGLVYFFLTDYDRAIEYHKQDLAIARELGDRRGEGQAVGNLGLSYLSLGDTSQAIEYYQQSLAIAQELKDLQTEANALGNLGLAYSFLGNYTKAIDNLEKTLAIARQIGDRLGEEKALVALASAHHALANYTKAIDYLQQSLTIAKELNDPLGEEKIFLNLGNAFHDLGNYDRAIEYYQQARAIARQIKDREGEASTLESLGVVYQSLGDYAQSIDYLEQSLAIAKEIKSRPREGAALGQLGNVYFFLGTHEKALNYLQQSLVIIRESQNLPAEAQVLGIIGNVYAMLGDSNQAIAYQQQSLTIARKTKNRNLEAGALGDLGVIYLGIGDYTKAIEYQEQSLTISREIKNRQGEGKALGNIGIAYHALGDYSNAIAHHQEALAIAKEIKDLRGEGRHLNNLGIALYDSGNLIEAEKILRTGIEARESIRQKLGDRDDYKISLFENQTRTYRTLQQVLIAQDKFNEALEISERGRARAFVDLLSSRLSTNSDREVPDPSLTVPTLSLIQQIAKEQNATIVEYSIIYDEFKIDGKLQFKESELYIWVVKPTGEVTYRKTNLKPLWQKQNISLDNLVTTSRDSIGVRGRGIEVSLAPNASQSEPLKQLYQLLIEPISDLLPIDPNERVIFIPQSSLFFVPFAALQDNNGKYLIEKHTILTAPSIQVLSLTRQQKQRVTQAGKQEILVVGNPTMPSITTKVGSPPEKLANLPGAEQEAIEIAQLLNTKAIKGNEATETAIVSQLPNAKIIHLATHGLLDDFTGTGVPGAIALASSNKDDGLLTANEIFDLKLNADLVVLSACDTGRGFVTGDGVIGLSRSLISAGTPSVIVSLWAVPDAPTAELMGEFYRQWQGGKMDKASALRQAMLTTMKQHPNPRDWAAFTLIGEAD